MNTYMTLFTGEYDSEDQGSARTGPYHDQLVNEALDACEQSWAAIRQSAWLAWMQLDLSTSQLKVLLLLDVHGQMPINGISKALALGRPSGSVLIEQLVQARLVVRSEDKADRRRTLVRLTDDAHRLLASLFYGAPNCTKLRLGELTDREVTVLAKGQRALAAAHRLSCPTQEADPEPTTIGPGAERAIAMVR